MVVAIRNRQLRFSRLFLSLSIRTARPHDDDERASPRRRREMKLGQIGRQSDSGTCLLRLLQDSIHRNLPSAPRAWQEDSSQLRREALLRA